jgi:glycine cleavage system transcriptional repressor
LIINAVGVDRLGIVSDITGLVIDAGGNVGESVAGRLGSHFSLMMLVEVPAPEVDDLKQRILTLPDMSATVFPASEKRVESPPRIGCKLFYGKAMRY